MTTSPNLVIPKQHEDRSIDAVLALVKMQNRNIDQLTLEIRDMRKDISSNGGNITLVNNNVSALAKATEAGFTNVNDRISKESQRTRSVTRLWSSFGFGVLTIGGKALLGKLGEVWNKFFNLLTLRICNVKVGICFLLQRLGFFLIRK
jgi:hypothetical protein